MPPVDPEPPRDPRRTGDPVRARHDLLERDRMFTDRLAGQTRRPGLPSIRVDTGTEEDDLVDRVERALGPPLVSRRSG